MSKNIKKEVVPDELQIYLHTNVPGFQNIVYKPKMTIPDEKSKSVEFNPLVKLKKSVINTIPENVRIREFFVPGLFNSLINAHGMKSTISLKDATKEGYVDNNIDVTLNTIFPVKSVIYINKEPYSIADIHWKQRDWSIKVKPKHIVDSSQVKDPYLYQALIQEEIERGENQIASLTTDVAYGNKYDGPQNPLVAEPSEETNEEITEPETPEQPEKKELLALPPPKQQEQPEKKELLALPAPEQPEKKELLALPPPEQPEKKELLALPAPEQPEKKEMLALPAPEEEEQPEKKELLALPAPEEQEQPEKKELLALPPPEEQEQPEKKELLALPPPEQQEKKETSDAQSITPISVIDDEPVVEPKIEYNKKIVQQVRDLFKSSNYKYLIDSIFQNLDEKSKNLILQNYRETTTTFVQEGTKSISKTAYNDSVDGLQIASNKGGGNCFFIAVADGINYYNFMNQYNKIKIGNYGSGELLITQQVLRQLTYEFIYNTFIKNKSEEDIKEYFEHATVYVDNLNELFKQQLTKITDAENSTKSDEEQNKTENENENENENVSNSIDTITPEQYDEIKLSIYNHNPNYLVTYDPGIPLVIDNYYKPFRLVKEYELKKYILSNHYWGDETAITAIKNKLGLNVMPLEIIGNKEDKSSHQKIIQLSRNYFLDDDWDKYMILLHTPGHFELMQFTFEEKKMGKRNKLITSKTKVTIYNRFRDVNKNPNSRYSPPIYILLSIFGGLFVSLNNQLQQTFTLLPQVFMTIFMAFTKIKDANTPEEINDVDKEKFFKIFLEYFPNAKNTTQSDQQVLTGGVNASRYSYHRSHNYSKHPNKHANKNTHANSLDKDKDIQICYIVDVTLMLKKGKEITDSDISNLTCNRKWNAINKSFSTLVGKTYEMPPDYDNMPSKYNKTKGGFKKTAKIKSINNSKTLKRYKY
jgi:hypothetical protein